jgi:membrane protease subunit HflC
MKQALMIVIGIIVVLILLVISGVFYVVDETKQVVITQFGEPKGDPVTTPGLKVKVPFIQKANYFDKRFLEWDGDRNEVPTKDKRFIFVDTYARWRITDPLRFYQRLHDERGAQTRLDDILDGETRNTIARHNLIEVVRTSNQELARAEGVRAEGVHEERLKEEFKPIQFGRDVLADEVLKAAASRTGDLGIEILDFRFKRINYVPKVQQEVYARMISERRQMAEQFRSEGFGESARISGEKERELKLISSEAYREAQEIKGRADAEAADIYARAYNRDAEFYRFYKSMQVLKTALDQETVLLLGTDGEFLRYLEQSK